MDISQPTSETPPTPPADSAPAQFAPETAAPDLEKLDRDHFSFRQFLRTAILFGTVVLCVRAAVIEPFGVPTGSMAPTLYGNHRECVCPRCGYRVVIGAANSSNGGPDVSRNPFASAWCPNCYQGDLHFDQPSDTAGDRLLVDKSAFDFRRPRRWEVAVFRNPSDLSKPYVKRVAGLPGEAIQIREGDVYVNGQLARKSLDQCRAARILVFDNDFQPAGDGWKMRWRRGLSPRIPQQLANDKSLADADEQLDGTNLKWSGKADDFEWLVYRHWLLDEKREEPIRDWFAYNGGIVQRELNDVHDFMVEFEIETGAGNGDFAIQLRDGDATAKVEIPIVGRGNPPRKATLVGSADLAVNDTAFLRAESSHRVEFALVDRRVMLAIDGDEAFPPVDLKPAFNRNGVSRPVRLGCRGVSVTVKHFRLFRDVYYSPNGRNAIYEPWPLGKDEFFMLGDNSANSEDSRYWTVPGVPEANFLGKPVLLHQPSRWGHIGNWAMQCLDWSRIRWIR